MGDAGDPNPPSSVQQNQYCTHCGYNLRGIEGEVLLCPECGHQSHRENLSPQPPQPPINSSQLAVAGMIAGLAIFILFYEFVQRGGLRETAMMFVGLPAVLAIALTLAPRAKTVTGMLLKGMTIALLVSGIFLREGFICLLIMSPLFYAIAVVVGVATDADRRSGGRRLRAVVAAPILLLSFEGVFDWFAFPRSTTVTAHRIIDAEPEQVREELARPPQFNRPLPVFLQLGFPRPVQTEGQGLGIGDRRVITMGGRKSSGQLVLQVAEASETDVRFNVVSDGSKISHWLQWSDSRITLEPTADGRTRVSWTLGFERRLDPVWYFAPVQRYGAWLAAGYLIDTLATPDALYPAERSAALVRSLAWLIPASLAAGLWLWRRPDRPTAVGAMLACAWLLPSVILLNEIARRAGWWRFNAEGGLFLGVPVDLTLGWVILWGLVPVLATPRLHLVLVMFLMLWIDLLMMPLCAPVVELGPSWKHGELAALVLCLLPAQLLARWTGAGENLAGRAFLQVICFSAIVLGIIPAIVIEKTGGSWSPLLDRPVWLNGLWFQLLAAAGLVGVSAVQEFARHGRGTPLPFDPPRLLVTSGVYAYVSNPMQLSVCAVLIVWGLMLANPWLFAGAVVALAYGIGLADWHEDIQLQRRFGNAWRTYCSQVPRWRLRLRPAAPPYSQPDRLYYASACAACNSIAAWIARRRPVHLHLVPAEQHPARDLDRLTFESADGAAPDVGVAALARALERIHLGWAAVGWLLRLPVMRQLAQLLVDAVGGGSRQVRRAQRSAAPVPPGTY